MTISFESLDTIEDIVDIDLEELKLEVKLAEQNLAEKLGMAEELDMIESLREEFIAIAVESDKSLLEHYRKPLEAVGVDCSSYETAAEGINALVTEVYNRELDGMEVSEEVISVATAAITYVILLAALVYMDKKINMIDIDVSLIQSIIDKGLRAEPKVTDKKRSLVPYVGFVRSIENKQKALKSVFDNVEEYDAAAAKKTTEHMKAGGQVWTGKDYKTSNYNFISNITIERAGWTPDAVTKANKMLKDILTMMLESRILLKELKEQQKKVNKEEGGGFFKKSEGAKELKAASKIAAKTLRTIVFVVDNYSGMLVTVARQYEK